MKRFNKSAALFAAFFATLYFASCATTGMDEAAAVEKELTLTLLHVNDTHSKVEATPWVRFTMDIDETLKAKGVYLNLGGFATLDSAVDAVRDDETNVLFVHGGDMFQGTLYFTKYLGEADIEFFNLMKLDAAVLGNHEFDRDPSLVQAAILNKAQWPVVASNLDVSQEGRITSKDKLLPWFIKEIDGTQVGFIGVTTVDTPFISSPGKVGFVDPVEAINKAAGELQNKGVNKIIVLSHAGYTVEKNIAAELKGVDLIVGGHSHSMLGEYPTVGMAGAGPYPTEVRSADGGTVLVVQAWEWAKMLGRLDLHFTADGVIDSYNADPRFLVNKGSARVYDLPNQAGELKRVQFIQSADGAVSVGEYDGRAYVNLTDDTARTDDQFDLYKAVWTKLSARLSSDPALLLSTASKDGLDLQTAYASGVKELNATIAADVAEDMPRGINRGPGDVIADSMTAKTGAQIAMMNPGGVRTNLTQGRLTVGQVYELQPFGNTLVTIDVKGSDLIKIFEDMVDFCVTSYGTSDPNTAYIYTSGVRFDLDLTKPAGQRIGNVLVVASEGSATALKADASYSLVVNSFCATGGDKNFTLKDLPGKYDTGFVDSEAMLDYVKGKSVANIKEPRVRLIR